ncbi:hypothetical protein TNCV_1993251 [Trichonephila clavipes]|nr:hypothetical protein TNCV_1993251 [Trichonephila clavipes]
MEVDAMKIMIEYWVANIESCRSTGLKNNLPTEIYPQSVKVYGTSVVSQRQEWFLCTKFDKDRKDTLDEKRAFLSNFYLFGTYLEDSTFKTIAEVQLVVMTRFHSLDTNFYDVGFDGLVYR